MYYLDLARKLYRIFVLSCFISIVVEIVLIYTKYTYCLHKIYVYIENPVLYMYANTYIILDIYMIHTHSDRMEKRPNGMFILWYKKSVGRDCFNQSIITHIRLTWRYLHYYVRRLGVCFTDYDMGNKIGEYL